MFDLLCIRRQRPFSKREPLDLAFLAEAMLFYQSVHLIADIDILSQLVSECGPALVIELIEEGFLKISYLEKQPGIQSLEIGRSIEHQWFQPAPIGDIQGSLHLEKIAPEIFSKIAGSSANGSQLGKRFTKLVSTLDIGNELLSSVREDFADQKYVGDAVAHLLSVIVPTYRLPQNYYFQLSKMGAHFHIDTTVDFRQLSESFRQFWKLTGDFDPAILLVYLFEARSDLFFAAREGAELATNPAGAAIIDVKCRKILSASSKSQDNIELFQEMVLGNGHEIGESIKLGYRTWADLLTLLKKARKFKEWLRQKDPNASLLHEYMKVLEKETWIGTTSTKLLRFLIFTGLGFIVQPVASIGLSAADAFLADRLLGGWKPDQFVNGPLKEFARLD